MESSLWQYITQHPARALEHATVLVLLLALAKEQRLRAACCSAGEAASALQQAEGPEGVFDAAGVSRAPPPAMDVSGLQEGGLLNYHDGRGDIYRLKLGDGVAVNAYKTKPGNMRSGDLHNCTQYNVVLKGTAVLTTRDIRTGRDAEAVYGPNQLVTIPARVPHLYDFPGEQDNFLLEWWDCPFEAWYYDEFRKRIRT